MIDESNPNGWDIVIISLLTLVAGYRRSTIWWIM